MKTIKLLTAGILLSGITTVKAQQTIDGVKIGFTGPAYGVTIDTQNYLQNYTGGWARGFWIGEYNKPTTIGFGSYGDAITGNINVNYSYIGKDWVNPFMTFNHNGNIGIGTTSPQGILDINSGTTGSIPVFRGNGGYIPTGLRFVDDSYTQPGQIQEWSIWKGNTWAKGLAFMRYDAVNRCNGGICDVSLFLADNGNVGIGNIANPSAQLEVNGDIKTTVGKGGRLSLFDNNATRMNQLHLYADNNGSNILSTYYTGGNSDINFLNNASILRMKIADNGNVGIGTATPDNLLSVQGNHENSVISLKSLGGGTPATEADLTLWASEPMVTYSGVGIGNNILHYNPNNGEFFKLKNAARGGSYMRLLDNQINFAVVSQTGTTNNAMVIAGNGNVGVGSSNPDEKLTVKGNIHAEEVRVDLLVPADYVFEKYYNGVSTLKADYSMPTLAEVEKYTKENNHLPNIPSAKEIQEKGLHVGEMTNLLLQKIEELTLYTIEQQKRIEALEAKLADKK